MTGSGENLLSEAGAQLLARIIQGRRAAVLYEGFLIEPLTDTDRREAIAQAWLWTDSPTAELGENRWLEMFNSVGFFSWPNTFAAPHGRCCGVPGVDRRAIRTHVMGRLQRDCSVVLQPGTACMGT